MIKCIKLNKDLYGFKAGTVLRIRTDSNGVPTNKDWRKRLKDSEKDGAVELLEHRKKHKALSAKP